MSGGGGGCGGRGRGGGDEGGGGVGCGGGGGCGGVSGGGGGVDGGGGGGVGGCGGSRRCHHGSFTCNPFQNHNQFYSSLRYPVSQTTVELVKSFFANDIAKHAELYMNAANIPGETLEV